MSKIHNQNSPELSPANFKKERWIWLTATVVILFLFIFSMFHLRQRGYYDTDNIIAELNYTPVDNSDNFDFSSASSSEVNSYINQLQLQYDNACVNSESSLIQTTGINLAMAYLKIHDRPQAVLLLKHLKEEFPYDTDFVKHCDSIISRIK